MNDRIESLIRQHEGSRLEFKETIDSAEALDRVLATIVAFANSAGGIILIGISDAERNVVGVKDPKKLESMLHNKIYDTIEPKVYSNIEILTYRNSYVVLVEVSPSSIRPHFVRNKKDKSRQAYIRIGSSTRLADNEMIEAIKRSVLPKFFDEGLCYEAKCEDVEFTDIAQYFSNKRILKKTDLMTLGILGEDNKTPTIGGILLFGKSRTKYFPDAFIKIAVFRGNNKIDILDTQKITANLPDAIGECLDYIRKKLDNSLVVQDLLHQELIGEIPYIALREAVINAVLHTDYSIRGAPITVKIFEDRIEIENTAILLGGLTIEELAFGGISKIRNPVIGRVFYEIGLIEAWGSGIERMRQVCINMGLQPPSFEAKGIRIRVTFYKKLSMSIIASGADEGDQHILRLLAFSGYLSTHQLAQLLGVSRRSVILKLNKLKDTGQVIVLAQNRNDPKKQYTLRDDGRAIRTKSLNKVFWQKLDNTAEMFLILSINFGAGVVNFMFEEKYIRTAASFSDLYQEKDTTALDKRVLAIFKENIISSAVLDSIVLASDQQISKAFKEKQDIQIKVSEEQTAMLFTKMHSKGLTI